MLFNSYVFVFAFLPVAVAGFYGMARVVDRRAAVVWLVFASLLFYSYWNPKHTPLLILSILVNYGLGLRLSDESNPGRRTLLMAGITFDLAVLGWFKYADFFGSMLGASPFGIVLPLAISFFTFQQIAYLVDAYRGLTREHDFVDYCLFVTFFPQLIAGPIVHHAEMLPQFRTDRIFKFDPAAFNVGLTLFVIGLFKKVVIADGMAHYVHPIFNPAVQGIPPTLVEAWVATLSYGFQLYFDFSGYSDMAIGLARMFGVKLPINFNAPFKSTSIADFWRRWHVTLSRFLRDYLYIPLGGNRVSRPRQYFNLFLTMLLGGLWHGAGWTYVFWGGLHGVMLVICTAYGQLCKGTFLENRYDSKAYEWGMRVFTFFLITVTWVFFRAETFDAAWLMFEALFGLHGLGYLGVHAAAPWLIVILTGVVFFAPHSMQILGDHEPVHDYDRVKRGFTEVHPILQRIKWQPTTRNAVIVAVLGVISVVCMSRVNEFLYFQF